MHWLFWGLMSVLVFMLLHTFMPVLTAGVLAILLFLILTLEPQNPTRL